MLKRPEFPFLVVAVAGSLLSWPLVEIYHQLGPIGRLGYFFCIWAVLVLIYLLWTRQLR